MTDKVICKHDISVSRDINISANPNSWGIFNNVRIQKARLNINISAGGNKTCIWFGRKDGKFMYDTYGNCEYSFVPVHNEKIVFDKINHFPIKPRSWLLWNMLWCFYFSLWEHDSCGRIFVETYKEKMFKMFTWYAVNVWFFIASSETKVLNNKTCMYTFD